MIQAADATKRFDGRLAVDHVSAQINQGSVFGLIGSNGAGKSTFLRLAAGILKPDEGSVQLDGQEIFESPRAKSRIFYISDEQYFYSNASPAEMRDFYCAVYPNFDKSRFQTLLRTFDLEVDRKINAFSKGMKKQLSVICGVCANTEYLFCDETFDGLDPVARQAVKTLFAGEIAQRGLTPVVASHNLRELEDICESVGLLHRGGILFERDLDEMKLNLHKVQCVIKEEEMLRRIKEGMEILTMDNRGALYTFTARGSRQEVDAFLEGLAPVFYELLPLSLEEIFISETEVKGYDVKELLF